MKKPYERELFHDTAPTDKERVDGCLRTHHRENLTSYKETVDDFFITLKEQATNGDKQIRDSFISTCKRAQLKKYLYEGALKCEGDVLLEETWVIPKL
jgi:hypothetical protein